MSASGKKNGSTRWTFGSLLPDRLTRGKVEPAPVTSSVSDNRRQSHARASVGAVSVAGSEGGGGGAGNTGRQDRVAWQTVSQNLTLQLDQRRMSELVVREVKPFNAGAHTTISELEPEADTSLLKVDVHVVPLEKLVQRFDSNLTKGLTTEAATQNRTSYGANKLTPPSQPSLIWMFVKQLLVGFNGILWVATLFAFLSYVRSRPLLSLERLRTPCPL